MRSINCPQIQAYKEDILMMITQSQQFLLQNIHNLSSNIEHRRINALSYTPSHPFSHAFMHIDAGVHIPSLVALLLTEVTTTTIPC